MKRRIIRVIIDITVCAAAGMVGDQHSALLGVCLMVTVASYGLYCFWDGVTSS